MSNALFDPITASLQILDRYRSLVRETIGRAGIPEAEADEIVRNLQVDHGMFLTANRAYAAAKVSTQDLSRELGLAPALSERLAARIPSLYQHQEEAIRAILAGNPTAIATGTGSGKTEGFLVPILDYCLKNSARKGVKAIIIYPMNALARDQALRIPGLAGHEITFGIFSGATPLHAPWPRPEDAPPGQLLSRAEIVQRLPDVLITNHVMLDWMLTRGDYADIFGRSSQTLKYIVVDELHSYRGNNAAHLKFLLRRLRHAAGNPPIIHLGASATLARTESEIAEVKEHFLFPLFDISACEVITPTYAAEVRPTPIPLPDDIGARPLFLGPNVSMKEHLANLEALLGNRVSQMALAKPKPYDDLRASVLTQRLKDALNEQGTVSFDDLAKMVEALHPELPGSPKAVEVAQAFLSTVRFMNAQSKATSQPVLDFRAHLFVRSITGHLKRCVKCGRFHSGRQASCRSCGGPLFYVYREDHRKVIAGVSGRELMPALLDKGEAGKARMYVTLEPVGTGRPSGVSSALISRIEAQGDKLFIERARDATIDEAGLFRIALLDATRHKIEEQLIPLANPYKLHEYMYDLVKTSQQLLGPADPRVLCFVDSRERASRYSTVLRDEFTSEFLEQFARQALDGFEPDIDAALELLAKNLPTLPFEEPSDMPSLDDLQLWFYRRLSSAVAQDPRTGPLALRDGPSDSESLAARIAEIFLAERAILKPDDLAAGSGRITFRLRRAITQHGIHIDERSGAMPAGYSSIALTADGRKYSPIIAAQLDRIKPTVEGELTQSGLLVARQRDDTRFFFLNPKRVTLRWPSPIVSDPARLVRDLCKRIELHSSELSLEKRGGVERNFNSGRTQVLIATPTLEMGVDIGGLRQVMMIGVPPSPTNYAQRAGRAGRKSDDRFAVIITLCDDTDSHDAYYFDHPRDLINGVIAPPRFKADNAEIVRKHLHAFVLSGHAESGDGLRRFLAAYERWTTPLLGAVQALFGNYLVDAQAYVQHELKAKVESALDSAGSEQPRMRFYGRGFFPDYGFRHDIVRLIATCRRATEGDEDDIDDRVISQREPELAIRDYYPGSRIFAANAVYRIGDEGEYETIDLEPVGSSKRPVRSYSSFLATPDDSDVTPDKDYTRFELLREFTQSQAVNDLGRVASWVFEPNCELLLINRGVVDGPETSSDTGSGPAGDKKKGQPDYDLGYRLVRDTLVFRFETALFSDNRVILSAIAALQSSIERALKLDSSDLRVAVGYLPRRRDPADSGTYVLLHDADGSGNAPIAEIGDRLPQLLVDAYEMLAGCDCEDGCHRCLITYTSHFYNPSPTRDGALMLIGYWLGRNRFVPSIAGPSKLAARPDIVVKLKRAGKRYEAWRMDKPSVVAHAEIDGAQYAVACSVLRQLFESIQSDKRVNVLVECAEDALVGVLNGNSRPGKAPQDLARLWYEGLRLGDFRARKGN
ncbi:MAG: DEAD/DEAH box helicase [Thermoflexales bacterium]|nr:DEAD/DEAH box helicase [Thermoflexales bacterium]